MLLYKIKNFTKKFYSRINRYRYFDILLKANRILVIIICISFLAFLHLYNYAIYKDLFLMLLSNSICILMTLIIVDRNKDKLYKQETYEIRKNILFRCNYILGLIIELWSTMVERFISEYDNDCIFSKKYYDMMSQNIDMTINPPGIFVSYIDYYDNKRSNIIYTINNLIQTYGHYIDPNIMSIISKIEICNMMQYDAMKEFDKNHNWTYMFYKDGNIDTTGRKFYISWDDLKKDFDLFKNFEDRINSQKKEFNSDIDNDFYSLNDPIFNIKESKIKMKKYTYDPFYNLASKFNVSTLHDRISFIEKQLEFFMRSKGVEPQKNIGQKFVDALLSQMNSEQDNKKLRNFSSQ